jgi:NAD(P)-dependent dehydrogenase (short-subunit alcohol dehydrogenase family)
LATHILGPHLMTERLLPLLRAARGASVVFVSSGGMYSTPLVIDDLESIQDYNGVRTYARTKRMQVVLADAWAHRLARSDVKVESMHPGWVDTPGVAEYLPRFRVITRPLLRDLADGADTAVWLVATRPTSKPGHFWHDRAQRPTTFGWQRPGNPATIRRFLHQISEMTATSKAWT